MSLYQISEDLSLLPVMILAMIILVKPPDGMENRKEHKYMRGREAQQYITNTRQMRPSCSPSLSPFIPNSCRITQHL